MSVGERVALRQEARRREVMAAAVAVFSERGYRAASMTDIAERLGMGKASLYHYVSSKEEILVDLYEEVLRESVIAARRIASAEQTARDALAETISDRVAYTCRNRELLRVFFEEEAELPARQQSRLVAVRHEYEQTLLEMVARGGQAGEFTLTTTSRSSSTPCSAPPTGPTSGSSPRARSHPRSSAPRSPRSCSRPSTSPRMPLPASWLL